MNALDKQDADTLYMASTEAESVKVFANTHPAMPVSSLNDLDSCALGIGVDTASVVEGVCSDERVGGGCGNPSFGYGG
jgi:UDPglucose 6-dehydrogenase